MKRTTKLSKSRTIEANNNGYGEGYVLYRELKSLVKQPVLYNYKDNREALRRLTSLTRKQYHRAEKEALQGGYIRFYGTTLYMLSSNEDKKLAKNDYIPTSEPLKTFSKIIIRNYYHKQSATIRRKAKHTTNSQSVQDFEYQKKVAPSNQSKVNRDITLSCRSLAKLFNRNSPAYGHSKKKELVEAGFISIHKNKTEILKSQAILYIKAGNYNVRHCKESDKWFYIHADTFTIANQRKESYYPKGLNYCSN